MDGWRKPSLSCPAVNGTGGPRKELGECWLTHCAALTPIGVLALIGFQIQGVNIYAIIHIGVSGLSPDAPVCVMGFIRRRLDSFPFRRLGPKIGTRAPLTGKELIIQFRLLRRRTFIGDTTAFGSATGIVGTSKG